LDSLVPTHIEVVEGGQVVEHNSFQGVVLNPR
jgi:hypothetical protein